jgi:predicted dehydrogenase
MVDIGFVGVGNIAGVHLDNLREYDRADVVAVCDIDAERAAAVGEEHGATDYTEYGGMLDAESLDAVYLCVPPFAHEGQERDVLERGLDLFVEKPLGLSREYARGVRDAVPADAVTQVGYVLRYSEALQRARDLLADRAVALVQGEYWVYAPDNAWWRAYDRSGGQVIEQSTHTFDAVRALAGDVTGVSAHGGREVLADDLDFSDTTVAAMTHETGAVSQVSSTAACDDGRSRVHVVAEGARLEIDLSGARLTGTIDGEAVDFEGDGEYFRREDEAFVDAVAAGDPGAVRSPYADAVESFEVTLDVTEQVEPRPPGA